MRRQREPLAGHEQQGRQLRLRRRGTGHPLLRRLCRGAGCAVGLPLRRAARRGAADQSLREQNS